MLPIMYRFSDSKILPLSLSLQVRFEKRKALFKEIDTSKNGIISLDEWVAYAYKHICSKAAGI